MENRYAINAGAVFSLKYHSVWHPQYLRPVLTTEVAARLRQLLSEKAAELGMTIHPLEVVPDHVRLFVASDPTRCVAEIVDRFKGFSSRMLRKEFAHLRSRLPILWSRSYYAETVGAVGEATIRRYVADQKGK